MAVKRYLFTPARNTSFGTRDFTVECWLRQTASTSYNLFTFSDKQWAVYYAAGSSSLRFWDGTADRITGGAVSLNTWHHIALTRSGNTVRLFLNGTIQGTAYTDTYITYLRKQTFYIGYYPNDVSVTGYVDDFRVTKGIARYTANFTAPTSEFTAQNDPYYPYVGLLLNFNGIEGNSNFVDLSPIAKDIAVFGSPNFSESQKKWGSASLFLDGSGTNREYLAIEEEDERFGSSTTWIVPNDWQTTGSKIICVGGGGAGDSRTVGSGGSGGGGGGEWAESSNISLTPGTYLSIGMGGGGIPFDPNSIGDSTEFGGDSSVIIDGSNPFIIAKGGGQGSGRVGGNGGGVSSSGTGDILYKGGTGGGGRDTARTAGGGGGAAGNPNAVNGFGGGNSSATAAQGGGGGGGTGGAGTSATTAVGGAGGLEYDMTTAGGAGGNAANGASDNGNGGGGGGGAGRNTSSVPSWAGGNGAYGTSIAVTHLWDTAFTTTVTVGPGGGGGGGGCNSNTTNTTGGIGGAGGWGAGGGGGGDAGTTFGWGGEGGHGFVIIEYEPSSPSNMFLMF